MIDQVVGHVVRRGMEAHAAFSNSKDEPTVSFPTIPVWGAVSLIALTVVFLYALLNIEYTLGRVVATLAQVESPAGIVFEPVSTDDEDATLDTKDGKLGLVEPDLLLVKQQPITASFRTAVSALMRGGRLSRFRGLFLYTLHALLTGWTTTFLSVAFIPRPIAAVISAIVFARLRMLWTHVVLVEPSTSPRAWCKRTLTAEGVKSFKLNVLPTALLSICEQATVGIPVIFFFAMGMDKYNSETLSNMTCAERKMVIVKILSIVAVCLISALTIVLPAQVILTRVQASMLTEEEDTTVPFDRSFGGTVIPRSEGGDGIVGMLEAWKTFDRKSRIRLVKIYLKVGIMQITVSMTYFVTILALLSSMMSAEDKEKVVNLCSTTFGASK